MCPRCAQLHILYVTRLPNHLAHKTVHFKTGEFYKLPVCTDRFRDGAASRVQGNPDQAKLRAEGGEIGTSTWLRYPSNGVKLFVLKRHQAAALRVVDSGVVPPWCCEIAGL